MSTQNDDYRAIEYWPSKDERRIVSIARTPETDAMTDEELVSRHLESEQEALDKTRLVTRTESSDHRTILVVRRDTESDKMTDAEIMAEFDEWRRGRPHLRSVADGE